MSVKEKVFNIHSVVFIPVLIRYIMYNRYETSVRNGICRLEPYFLGQESGLHYACYTKSMGKIKKHVDSCPLKDVFSTILLG